MDSLMSEYNPSYPEITAMKRVALEGLHKPEPAPVINITINLGDLLQKQKLTNPMQAMSLLGG